MGASRPGDINRPMFDHHFHRPNSRRQVDLRGLGSQGAIGRRQPREERGCPGRGMAPSIEIPRESSVARHYKHMYTMARGPFASHFSGPAFRVRALRREFQRGLCYVAEKKSIRRLRRFSQMPICGNRRNLRIGLLGGPMPARFAGHWRAC